MCRVGGDEKLTGYYVEVGKTRNANAQICVRTSRLVIILLDGFIISAIDRNRIFVLHVNER